MIWIFNKYQSETFTYFIASPPLRTSGYREKELDCLTKLFSNFSIKYKIAQTITSQSGFWIILDLKATQSNFKKLKASTLYKDYQIEGTTPTHGDDFELISENDEGFSDVENFKL